MKIIVKQVGYEGQTWEKKVRTADIGLENGEVRYADPVSVTAKVSRAGSTLLVEAAIEFDCEANCARCLEKIGSRRRINARLDYPVDPSTDIIDISDDVRQEIILKTPGRLLCRDDCRGLCPHCGANLNRKTCRCHEEAVPQERIRGINNIKSDS